MSLSFGPLSAERIDLHGLSKSQAMRTVRKEILLAIRQIAPPRPQLQLPHEPNHRETGPWLFLGLSGALDAGRWYQACKICDPVIHHFITDRLDSHLLAGDSSIGRLLELYQEIKVYPDDVVVTVSKSPSSAATRVRR